MTDQAELGMLVGRVDETRAVREALTRGAHRKPQILEVSGDPGIGKSTLAAEAGREAISRGFAVLVGACLDVVSDAPFAPVLQAVRPLLPAADAALRGEDPATPAATVVARLLAGAEAGSHERAGAALAPGQALECLRELVVQAAATRPVLLVLEDMQWADQSTRDFLVALSAARDQPLVVLVTYRADEVHRRHPLRPCLRQLRRAPGWQSLAMLPLDDAAARELVDRLTQPGRRQVDHDRVCARAEGNPLYLEELVAAAGDGDDVPRGLADLFLSRLDALSPETAAVLRTAAVGGTAVDDHLLLAVADEPVNAVDTALREAVDRNALVRHAGGLAFRHALLREAIYDDLLPSQRSRLHGRYGDALVDRSETHAAGSGLADAALVAFHRAAAGDIAAALPAALQAGRMAARLGLPEAASHLDRVLGWWPHVPDATELTGMSQPEVLCLTAASVAVAGEPERAQAMLLQALDLIDIEKQPLLASRIYAVRADHVCAAVGDTKEQQLALDRAVSFAEGTPSEELAHALTLTASHLLVYYGRCWDTRRLGERARTVALAVGEDQDEAKAAALVAVAQIYTGELDEGVADAQAAMDRLEHTGPISDALLFRGLHAYALGATGRPHEAIAVARGAAERATALGLPGAAFYCASAEIFLCGRVGLLDEAEHRLATLLHGWQPGKVREITLSVAAELWTRRGELTSAAEAFGEVRAWFAEAGDLHDAMGDLSPMVDLYLAQGEPDNAAELALQLGLASDELDGDWDLATMARRTLASAAAVRAARGTPPKALLDCGNELLDRTRAAADRGGCSWGTVASAELASANAWQLSCAGMDTRTAWQRAREAWEATGLGYDLLECTAQLAVAAFAEGDREAGQHALRDAWTASRRMGANGLTRSMAALARRTRTNLDDTYPLSGGSGAGLTDRELDVLALVAAGRSNPQIAGELYMSRKTASAYVSRILGKLGVASRGEAAAYAWAHGLAEADRVQRKPHE